MKTLKELDIGYPIIFNSVGLLYWYFELNIETNDVVMVVLMMWIYWKFETCYPNLWSGFKLKKPLMAFISISCGLIARIIAKLILLIIK